jgi:hypothetical protein
VSRFILAAVLAAIFAFGVAAPGAGAAPGDACSLLTQAQIKSATGAEVSAGVAGSPKLCQWNASMAPGATVNFVTLVLQDPKFFESGKNMPAPANVPVRAVVTPVSGVGDDAYFVAVRDQVGLVVKKGSSAFKVAVYAKLPNDQKETMEKSLAMQIASQL